MKIKELYEQILLRLRTMDDLTTQFTVNSRDGNFDNETWDKLNHAKEEFDVFMNKEVVDFEFSTPEAERDYKKFKKAMDEKYGR